MNHEKQATELCTALKALINSDYALSNFECYLSNHFDAWLSKYANTPDGLVSEITNFASITN